jgi:hypothetical protein
MSEVNGLRSVPITSLLRELAHVGFAARRDRAPAP